MTRRRGPRALSLLLGVLLALGINTLSFNEAQARGFGKHKSSSHHKHHRRHSSHRRHHSHRSHHFGYYGHDYFWGYGYGPYWGPRVRARWVGRETQSECGFRYLAEGHPKRAVSIFAKLAESEPYDALPKLGYAIAMSELDELELGVWAMRRAIRTDPEILRKASFDPALRPRVLALLEVYHPHHSDDPQVVHSEDAHFMVAALLWVLGDEAGAASAAQWAIADGDDHESTRVLSRAIAGRASATLERDVES